jgi:hypothetical protein
MGDRERHHAARVGWSAPTAYRRLFETCEKAAGPQCGSTGRGAGVCEGVRGEITQSWVHTFGTYVDIRTQGLCFATRSPPTLATMLGCWFGVRVAIGCAAACDTPPMFFQPFQAGTRTVTHWTSRRFCSFIHMDKRVRANAFPFRPVPPVARFDFRE